MHFFDGVFKKYFLINIIFLDLAISGHTESHKSMEISFERENHIRIHKVVSKGNKIIKCDKHAAMATWYFS